MPHPITLMSKSHPHVSPFDEGRRALLARLRKGWLSLSRLATLTYFHSVAWGLAACLSLFRASTHGQLFVTCIIVAVFFLVLARIIDRHANAFDELVSDLEDWIDGGPPPSLPR